MADTVSPDTRHALSEIFVAPWREEREALSKSPTWGDLIDDVQANTYGAARAGLGMVAALNDWSTEERNDFGNLLIEWRDTLAEKMQEQLDQMTPSGRRVVASRWIPEEGDASAWERPGSKLAHDIIGNLPYALPMILGVVASYLGVPAALAVGTAAVTGAAMESGDVYNGIEDQIRSMSEEELEQSPEYQQLKSEGVSFEQAKEQLVQKLSPTPVLATLGVSALLEGVGLRYIVKPSGGWLKRTGKGVGAESGTEFAQESFATYAGKAEFPKLGKESASGAEILSAGISGAVAGAGIAGPTTAIGARAEVRHEQRRALQEGVRDAIREEVKNRMRPGVDEAAAIQQPPTGTALVERGYRMGDETPIPLPTAQPTPEMLVGQAPRGERPFLPEVGEPVSAPPSGLTQGGVPAVAGAWPAPDTLPLEGDVLPAPVRGVPQLPIDAQAEVIPFQTNMFDPMDNPQAGTLPIQDQQFQRNPLMQQISDDVRHLRRRAALTDAAISPQIGQQPGGGVVVPFTEPQAATPPPAEPGPIVTPPAPLAPEKIPVGTQTELVFPGDERYTTARPVSDLPETIRAPRSEGVGPQSAPEPERKASEEPPAPPSKADQTEPVVTPQEETKSAAFTRTAKRQSVQEAVQEAARAAVARTAPKLPTPKKPKKRGTPPNRLAVFREKERRRVAGERRAELVEDQIETAAEAKGYKSKKARDAYVRGAREAAGVTVDTREEPTTHKPAYREGRRRGEAIAKKTPAPKISDEELDADIRAKVARDEEKRQAAEPATKPAPARREDKKSYVAPELEAVKEADKSTALRWQRYAAEGKASSQRQLREAISEYGVEREWSDDEISELHREVNRSVVGKRKEFSRPARTRPDEDTDYTQDEVPEINVGDDGIIFEARSYTGNDIANPVTSDILKGLGKTEAKFLRERLTRELQNATVEFDPTRVGRIVKEISLAQAGNDAYGTLGTDKAIIQAMIGMEGGTFAEGRPNATPIIEALLAHPELSDNYRRMLLALRATGVGDTSFVVLENLPGGAVGTQQWKTFPRSTPYQHRIELDYKKLDGMLTTAFIHELAHSATIPRFLTDPDFNRTVIRVFRDAMEYLDVHWQEENTIREQFGDIVYAMRKPEEMLAEVFANPQVAAFLKSVPTIGSNKGRFRSLWDTLVAAVRRTLNMLHIPQTAINKILTPPTTKPSNAYEDLMAARPLRDKATTRAEAERSYAGHDTFDTMEAAKQLAAMKRGVETAFGVTRETGEQVFELLRDAAPGSRNKVSKWIDAQRKSGAVGHQELASWLKASGSKLRQAMNGALTLRQLEDWYSKMMDPDAPFRRGLADYTRWFFMKEETAKQIQQRADEILGEWATAASKPYKGWKPDNAQGMTSEDKAVEYLMLEETLHDVYADKPWEDDAHAHLHLDEWEDPKQPKSKSRIAREAQVETSRRAHQRLQEMWNELSPETQELHDNVAAFYQAERKTIALLIRGNFIEQYNRSVEKDADKLSTDFTLEDLEKEDGPYAVLKPDVKDAIKQTFLMLSTPGPYFPLRRFGDYVVAGTVDEDVFFDNDEAFQQFIAQNPGAKFSKMESGPYGSVRGRLQYPHVEFHETMGKADAAHKALVDDKTITFELQQVSKRTQYLREAKPMQHKIFQGVMESLKSADMTADQRAKLQSIFTQTVLQFMPDAYALKAELRRRKVAGASTDMKRAFSAYAMSSAHLQSQLMYSSKLSDALTSLQNAIRDARKSNPETYKPETDPVLLDDILKELTLRDNADAEPIRIPTYVQWLSDFGFVNYLASPSYWAINATQPGVYALPILAAKFGHRAAVAEMERAYSQMFPEIFGHTKKRLGVAKGVYKDGDKMAAIREFMSSPETYNVVEYITKRLRANGEKGLADAIEEVGKSGLIDLTFVMDLRREAGGETGGGNRQMLMDMVRLMPHLTEVMNRTVTAAAAYNLSMKRYPNDKGMAISAMREAIALSQFDYSSGNRPRYFQGRNFPLARTALMFKMHPQGVYYLMFKMARAAIRGGELGRGGYSRKEALQAIRGLMFTHFLAAGTVGMIFEPAMWALGAAFMMFGDDGDDPEQAITRLAYDFFGPTLGEVISHGAPTLINMDLSNRVGIHNLAFFGSGGGGLDRETFLTRVAEAVGGPMMSYGANMFDGLGDIADGDYIRGARKILPQPFRSVLKAGELGYRGLADSNGMELMGADEMNPWELFLTATGFTTTDVSRVWRGRSAVYAARRAIEDKRNQLLRRATQNESGVHAYINQFNRAHPEYAITGETIARSRRSRQARQKVITQNRGVYAKRDEILDRIPYLRER